MTLKDMLEAIEKLSGDRREMEMYEKDIKKLDPNHDALDSLGRTIKANTEMIEKLKEIALQRCEPQTP